MRQLWSMADVEFENDTDAAISAHYGTIVVIGGGCYGSYYVRQLGRANRAGALSWNRILVVDRSADCLVATSEQLEDATLKSPAPELVVADWGQFFGEYLSRWRRAHDSHESDAIVPSPLMPHLLYEWVRDRAIARWPDRTISTRPLATKPDTPWETAAPDGTHYVSFATWTCPINCIEPKTCPHTRSERTWTMPRAMREIVDQSSTKGRALAGPLVFHCTHRAYGVGMIPVMEAISADMFIQETAAVGPAEILVATVSHCHGAANVLSIG